MHTHCYIDNNACNVQSHVHISGLTGPLLRSPQLYKTSARPSYHLQYVASYSSG